MTEADRLSRGGRHIPDTLVPGKVAALLRRFRPIAKVNAKDNARQSVRESDGLSAAFISEFNATVNRTCENRNRPLYKWESYKDREGMVPLLAESRPRPSRRSPLAGRGVLICPPSWTWAKPASVRSCTTANLCFAGGRDARWPSTRSEMPADSHKGREMPSCLTRPPSARELPLDEGLRGCQFGPRLSHGPLFRAGDTSLAMQTLVESWTVV